MYMMRMRKRGFTACASIAALVATGLWATTSTPAVAGGVSVSIGVPGLAIHTGPQGVAVAVGQPGFYGEIGVGDLPAPPPVIYTRPVIIEGSPVGPPVYLHVPPGYERHWAEHCAYYHACGRPVYFVQDDWYQHVYVPRYQHEQVRHDRDEHFRDATHEREVDHDGDHAYRDHDNGARRDADHRDYGHDDRDHGHDDHGHGDDQGRGN
jgi:hypothetical protein